MFCVFILKKKKSLEKKNTKNDELSDLKYLIKHLF